MTSPPRHDDPEAVADGPRARDHWEEHPTAWVAGVSDRGRRHRDNQDAMALAAIDPETSVSGSAARRAALVVCDGVSSTAHSDDASMAAARAALTVLTHAPEGVDPEHSLGEAGRTAAFAVAKVTSHVQQVGAAEGGPSETATPACTFVAADIAGRRVAVASIGDSRAYWVPDAGEAEQLTVDDSWAQEQIKRGVPADRAHTGRLAHSITRWIGVTSPDQRPHASQRDVTGPGWVVLCSDGLWNYARDASDLADVVRRCAVETQGHALDLARTLVAWANEQGGQDNITVTLARIV